MNAELQTIRDERPEASGRRSRLVTGLALIGLGLVWMMNEFVDFNFGALVLPLLAAIFIVWGILTRESGLLIPGGILGGVGAGVYLMSALPLEGSAHAGVFMLSMGFGFASVTLMSAVFTDETHWWALIPGGIIGLVGIALMVGGVALTALSLIGRFWPVILILIGLGMIFRRR